MDSYSDRSTQPESTPECVVSLPRVSDASVQGLLSEVDIILTDIDGTFCTKNQGCEKRERLLEQNIAALEKLEKLGIPVAFMTGRNFCTTVDFFGKPCEWLSSRPGVYGDGNYVLGADGNVLYCKSVPAEAVTRLVDAVRDVPNVCLLGFTGLRDIYQCGDRRWSDWHHDCFGGPKEKNISFDEFRALNLPFQSIYIWDYWLECDPHTKMPNTGCLPETFEKIRAAMENCDDEVKDCIREKRQLVKLTNVKCTKEFGAQALITGLGKKNPLFLGDDLNDICVFKAFPGRGVAMGNAIPETKAVAGMVTGDFDADRPGWAELADAIVASKQ